MAKKAGTLDNRVYNLAPLNDKGEQEVAKYDSDNFYHSSRGLEVVASLDFSKAPQRKLYDQLTSEDTDSMEGEELEDHRKWLVRGGGRNLGLYVDKNFEEVAGEAPLEQQVAWSWEYTPSKSSSDKDFEKVRGKVYDLVQEREVIAAAKASVRESGTDKTGYFAKAAAEQLSPGMAYFASLFKSDFLKWRDFRASKEGSQAIVEFGAPKYLNSARAVIDPQVQAVREAEDESKARKDNPDYALGDLTQKVTSGAVSFIERRMAEEEAKKKAAEEDKKKPEMKAAA